MRQLPYEKMSDAAHKALIAHRNGTAAMEFLSDLADRAEVRLDPDGLSLLLGRLAAAGVGMPELDKGEGGRVLLTARGDKWTLQHFMAAMLSERDQAEIKSLEDLRLYARRVYALVVLLPRRGAELGLRDAERVEKGVEKTLREALIDRLRQVEIEEKIQLSEEDLRDYYDRHREDYVRSERITILEVLLETREEAEILLQKIEAGENLAELAGRHSVSQLARQAGGRAHPAFGARQVRSAGLGSE